MNAEEVSELLTGSHALLMTSLGFDNQPMVILEAFAHGRPVILTDPVLAGEFGEAALLSETPDAEGLAKLLIDIASDLNRLTQPAAAAQRAGRLSQAQKHAETLEQLALELKRK